MARVSEHLKRARLLALPLLAFALWSGAAGAQATLSAVGVFSLLGDGVQLAAATDAPTDTGIERSQPSGDPR